MRRPVPNGAPATQSAQWTWWLLLGVVFFEYLRPTDGILGFLAPLRLGGIMAAAMVVVFLIHEKKYLREESLHTACIVFGALAASGTLWAYNNSASFFRTLLLFWATAGFTFPICVILGSKERIYKYIYYWIFVQALLAIYVIFHGGHGTGSYLQDENDVGLVLNMAIPYSIFMLQFPGITFFRKVLLCISIALLLVAIGVSGSRGAIVGLLGVLVTMIWLSKRPVVNALWVGAVGVIAVLILLRTLPEAYVKDVENMNNPKDSTRDERLWSWSIGWVMFKENPVFGVGAGNYPWTNHLYAEKSPMYTPKRKILGGREAHSLYFTVLPEFGIVGTSVFASIFVLMFRRYRTMRKCFRARAAPTDDEKRFNVLFIAMMSSTVGFLLTSTFISVLYYPPFWHLLGLFAATYRVAVRDIFPEARVQPALPRGARAPRPA
jgi:O-antigen ligase